MKKEEDEEEVEVVVGKEEVKKSAYVPKKWQGGGGGGGDQERGRAALGALSVSELPNGAKNCLEVSESPHSTAHRSTALHY